MFRAAELRDLGPSYPGGVRPTWSLNISKLPQSKYWVYIMSNYSGTLYIGMADNLERGVWEHRHGDVPYWTTLARWLPTARSRLAHPRRRRVFL